jgi:hypothetical protein
MREMRGLRRKERAEKTERATAHLKSGDRRIESKNRKVMKPQNLTALEPERT